MTDDELRAVLKMIRGRPRYMGKKGEPLTLIEMATLHEDNEYRVIGWNDLPATSVHPPSQLSTAWLGIDHSFGTGPPLIFETMRFKQERTWRPAQDDFPGYWARDILTYPDPEDPDTLIEQMRYSTEEQARLSHAAIVRLIQEREMS